MRVRHWCAIGLATLFGGSAMAQTPGSFVLPGYPAQSSVPIKVAPPAPGTVIIVQADDKAAPAPAPQGKPEVIPAPVGAAPSDAPMAPTETPDVGQSEADEGPLGPTPLLGVKILQGALDKAMGYGCDDIDPCTGKKKENWLHIAGWIDVDYTYRSTGTGQNNVAPVMNRFGDEFLNRQNGLYLWKATDDKEWSWGFNAILITGSDAAFLNPTAGWYNNTNPRYGISFTDLNLSLHTPILTDGGVDWKIGRQTTCLGPMGALPWQRYFDSSDYQWYNVEEGRYTGVSANWHITKQLSWYNAIELGGWGVFFDSFSGPSGPDYLGQINYWLDCEAKKTCLTATVLTGPTGVGGGNTTTWEFTVHQNWNKYIYQVISHQGTYSKAPVFFQGPPPPGYQERAYSVYSYLGAHLSKDVDINTRIEWYRDVDGGGYSGGFGVPKTNYYEATIGFDYHPVKWLQLRPELRYDWANNDNFGTNNDKKNQLSIACDALLKF